MENMGIQNANEIHLNGKRLVKGDEGTIKVIFNNLTGKNFDNQPTWKTQTHAEYLSMMAAEYGVTFAAGFIELVNSDKVILDSHQF